MFAFRVSGCNKGIGCAIVFSLLFYEYGNNNRHWVGSGASFFFFFLGGGWLLLIECYSWLAGGWVGGCELQMVDGACHVTW